MKTIARFYSLLIPAMLVFMLMPAQGQLPASESNSFVTVGGQVRDARTRQPIAFASVFVPGTSVGTVTNLDGVFSLKIQKDLGVTHFAISHLGYRVTRFAIDAHTQAGGIFSLEPHTVELPAVVIRPRDPRSLVVSALNKVTDNYPLQAHRLTGFYREAVKQRRDYISISEAIVEIYQAPYGFSIHNDRTRILQGRNSGDVKRADTLVVKLQGGPHVSMMLDIIKNPDVLISKESIDHYSYEFIDVVQIDDAMHYVIGFQPRLVFPYPLYYGRLYIHVDNLAITMAEFSLDLSDRDKAALNFVMRKPARLRFTPTNTNYLVTYKEIDGKYHLNYVRSEVEFFADWRRRIFRTGYSVMAEMAITDRETDNVERFTARDSFRPTTILADLVPMYFDEAFWGAYNVIVPDESIEQAIQRFNRRLEP